MTVSAGVPFVHAGREIVAVDNSPLSTCDRCMYKSDADCLKNPECSGIKRTDKKYVYFLPVQDYIVLRLKGEL